VAVKTFGRYIPTSNLGHVFGIRLKFRKRGFMRTALIILSLWLLLNVLVVVVMMPPRKPRRSGASDAELAPATIHKEAYPFEAEEEKTSLGFVIMSFGMGALFVLVPPIAEAQDAIKNFFRKKPPADGACR
jgi:hypothetical protein